MSVGDRLKLLAKAAGYEHLSEFAEAAGVRPGTAQQQASRESIPWSTAQRYIVAARRTGATIEWLMENKGQPPKIVDKPEPAPDSGETPAPEQLVPAPDAPFPPSRMPLNVPILGAAVGGNPADSAAFEFNGDLVGYARRPPYLTGRKDVFAVYVYEESMAHWRVPGQLVYVERLRPPRENEYVLVEFHPQPGESVRRAMIKRLLGTTPTKFRLRQYNPPKDFEVDRRTVLQCLRVMDWEELLSDG